MEIEDPSEHEVWLYELAQGVLSRLTFGGDNHAPIWTPDGKRIAFGSGRTGNRNIFWKFADGNDVPEQLTSEGHYHYASSWSPDGRTLAFSDDDPTTAEDIWLLTLKGVRQPFLQTAFTEKQAVFSPDGRWVAYTSNESGRFEVYVRPFPGPGGRTLVSTNGGTEPVWSPNGSELFYRNGDEMLAVSVAGDLDFTAAKPKLLFEKSYEAGATPTEYDVSPDGQRFVMIERSGNESAQISVVLNWFNELERLVPANN